MVQFDTYYTEEMMIAALARYRIENGVLKIAKNTEQANQPDKE